MKKLYFIHPLLFSLYPALFLYIQNINQFKENVLLVPLLISFLFSSFLYVIITLITRKQETAAIISSFLILIFFSYGKLKEPINNINLNFGKVSFGPDYFLFAAIFFLFIFLIFLIFKFKRFLRKTNQALTILSLILISITSFNFLFSEIKLGRVMLSSLTGDSSQIQDLPTSEQTPDIYYFIFDRYAGAKTLKNYGFDNNDFLNFLTSKGFYIASEATSNYPKTFLSLGSSLNMEYLDFLTKKTNGGQTSDESFVTPLVQNNKVVKLLKNKGYAYIHVGSGWDPTRSNKNANLNFVLKGGRYPFADEFTSGFLQSTMASPILKKVYYDKTAVSRDPKNNDHRSRVLYEFEVFNQIPQIPGPKFVFAHILLPHDPYVLDKDCEPLTEKIVKKRAWIENYLNHVQCTNIKTKEIIEKILSNSEKKPIIIIQADEGPMPMRYPVPYNLAWKKASDDTIREKFPILSAFLLPNIKTNPIYPSVTPVNSFRIIFNTYFKANLPLLPDKNYIFDDVNSYYKFTEVTDEVQNKP